MNPENWFYAIFNLEGDCTQMLATGITYGRNADEAKREVIKRMRRTPDNPLVKRLNEGTVEIRVRIM